MQLSDFSFDLPDELIARYPLESRSASRLLHIDDQGHYHDQVWFFPKIAIMVKIKKYIIVIHYIQQC